MIVSRASNSHGVCCFPPSLPLPPFENSSIKKYSSDPLSSYSDPCTGEVRNMWLKRVNSGNLLQAEPQVCASNAESEKGGLFALTWKLCWVHLPPPFTNNQEIGKVTVLQILASHSAAARSMGHDRKRQQSVSQRKMAFPSSRLFCLRGAVSCSLIEHLIAKAPQNHCDNNLFSF